MALAGVKFDDGRGGFASSCFPVRPTFGRTSDEANGAWLVAHHAEQRRRFKAVLCTKPLTYSRIKEERKKSELQGTKLVQQRFEGDEDDEEAQDDEKVLDGFFLMKHCCIEDPSDLCSVNIAGQELTEVKEDDLPLFENVAYVNAGENFLPFEAFRGFPCLRELEMPLNGLRSLQIDYVDFSSLEMLDLSYNNLSQGDLLGLGLLSHLKVLHLTGNHFRTLPPDMAMPYLSREKNVRFPRYNRLEVLLLDDNNLMEMSIFAALAGLPKLRHLNLSKNELFFVPQLQCVEGRVVTQDGKSKGRRKRPKSGRLSSRRARTEARNGARSKAGSSQQEVKLVDLEVKPEQIIPSNLNASTQGSTEISAGGPKETSVQAGETIESMAAQPSEVMSEISGPKVVAPPDEVKLQVEEKPELLAGEFTSDNLTAKISELEIDLKAPETDRAAPREGMQVPPFPELRYLNLSHNQICEEDALLAVAAWPMLLELDIYANPLTNETSGDPPLLRRFLQERLHIKLNRIKPEEKSGFSKAPKSEIRPKTIKIQEIVAKVPRLTVEEKMRLELPAPPPQHAIEHGSHGHQRRSVLPPIPSTPKEELTEAWAERIIEEEEEELAQEEEEWRSASRMGEEEGFFMTGMPDVFAAKPHPPSSGKKDPSSVHTGPAKSSSVSGSSSTVDSRYKGYEILLDIEELDNEPELPDAKDIQGNIRALKATLTHQLVYRDPRVELTKVKVGVKEYRRAPVPPSKPHQSQQEKIDDVLWGLKSRSIVEEEKLTTVLKDKAKYRHTFPEAEELLGKIQRKYNAVRVHSLKDKHNAKDMAKSMLNMIPPSK